MTKAEMDEKRDYHWEQMRFRQTIGCSFEEFYKQGWDACYEIMQKEYDEMYVERYNLGSEDSANYYKKELDAAKEREHKLVEALKKIEYGSTAPMDGTR